MPLDEDKQIFLLTRASLSATFCLRRGAIMLNVFVAGNEAAFSAGTQQFFSVYMGSFTDDG